MTTQPLTIRLATASDAAELAYLAELDSTKVRRGDHVVAEIDGRLLAALALEDGVTFADPFEPTADVVALLKAHVAPQRRHRRRFGRLIPRPAIAA